MTLFPLGANRWIAMDFVGPDVEPEEVREAARIKRNTILYGWLSRKKDRQEASEAMPTEPEKGEESGTATAADSTIPALAFRGRHLALSDDATTVVPTEGVRSAACSPAPTELGIQSRLASPEPEPMGTFWKPSNQPNAQLNSVLPTTVEDTKPTTPNRRRRTVWKSHARTFYKSLVTPASLAIILSFPIALVPQLKGLFVDVPGVKIHPAPDGNPPLAFFIETTAFIGAASVPLGLICLGSALARLNVPTGNWNSLPLGAISSLAIGKMLITPVLGVLIVKGLVKSGVIPEADKVLQFVCM